MVSVRSLQRRERVSLARVRGTASLALGVLGRPDADVHVTLVDDATIRRLNGRYLGVHRATDVLAFNLESPGPSPLLGEVIVSAETAARQARRLRVPTALELDLLVVHGLLHLVGYDDAKPGEARLMHERERQILSSGVGPGRRRAAPARLWAGLIEDP